MDDFERFVAVGDVELDGAFDAVEVVVETRVGGDKEGGADAVEV